MKRAWIVVAALLLGGCLRGAAAEESSAATSTGRDPRPILDCSQDDNHECVECGGDGGACCRTDCTTINDDDEDA